MELKGKGFTKEIVTDLISIGLPIPLEWAVTGQMPEFGGNMATRGLGAGAAMVPAVIKLADSETGALNFNEIIPFAVGMGLLVHDFVRFKKGEIEPIIAVPAGLLDLSLMVRHHNLKCK